MRPIAVEQDSLRYPLNHLLGTAANVRLLRLLTEGAVGPIGAGEAARRTGLTEAGARRAFTRLAETGFVQRIGGGRYQQFGLREGEPLVEQLRRLFHTEDERFRSFLSRIRSVLGELPEVQIAWVDASPSGPGQPFHVGIVSDSRSLTYLSEQIRQRIEDVEVEFDTTIELHTFSRADAPVVDWDTAQLLAGHPDRVLPGMGGGGPDHVARDQRAAKLSEAIVELLERDPSLIKRASRHVELLLREDQGMAAHDLKEWGSILSRYSRQRLSEFLVSDTPRAQRLRQSSPFFAVLSADERDEVLQRMEAMS
jgi:DNA-binding Lrp family transcriptional regulator